MAVIIQFQIFRELCLRAGQYDPDDPDKPLFNCDFAGNVEAGSVLKKLMEKGFSENWQDVLEAAIGVREMDEGSILEYFEPLRAYLAEQKALHGYSNEWKMFVFEQYYDHGWLDVFN